MKRTITTLILTAAFGLIPYSIAQADVIPPLLSSASPKAGTLQSTVTNPRSYPCHADPNCKAMQWTLVYLVPPSGYQTLVAKVPSEWTGGIPEGTYTKTISGLAPGLYEVDLSSGTSGESAPGCGFCGLTLWSIPVVADPPLAVQ